MSTAIAKNFQVGSDGTATNNFTIRQPATPDGTVRIANGNSGTTTDLVTVTSAGNVGVGTTSPTAKLDVSGTAAVSGSFAVAGNNISAVNSMGFRNRIINGDMRIDQRNAGAAVTVNSAANNTFSVDRWQGAGETTDGVFTLQQSSVAPTGFTNSMLATVTTADASIGASQRYFVQQRIEGFNTADFGWGAAGALSVTLSFWVRSSLTGTFGGSIRNSAGDRSYPFSYTISAANTWEQKSVTIAGDTTGTWVTNNGIGMFVTWGLGVGSSLSGTAGAWAASGLWSATGAVNVISTNGATFYITGVQLEAGSVATPFERRDYGRELIMCQRYFETYALNNTSLIGNSLGTTSAATVLLFKVTKRAAPTITLPAAGQTSGTISFLTSSGAFPSATGTNTSSAITVDKATIDGASYTGLTAASVSILWSSGSSTIQINAEL